MIFLVISASFCTQTCINQFDEVQILGRTFFCTPIKSSAAQIMNFITVSAIASALVAQSTEAKKIFIDNDGLAPLHVLFPIAAGHEIVGLSGSFGSASLVDSFGQGYDILETYNLSSCVPQYVGANQPLLRTNETFQAWESLFGFLQWQGAWAPSYVDSYTWDNFTDIDTTPGAIALVDAVKKYKDSDPVTIYAAGLMTTVAQALSIYPDLVKDAAGLYIMGGYIDGQYASSTGHSFDINLNTDINLIQDPEAAQIVLSADWKEFCIGSNVTNYLVPSQELYDAIIEKAGGYEVLENTSYMKEVLKLVGTGNYSLNGEQGTLPFWDEVVSAYWSWPELIEETIAIKCSVDTSFYSPFYGSLRIYNPEYAPPSPGYKTANATMVTKINDEKFYDLVVDILFQNWTQYCTTGGSVPLVLNQE